MITLFYLVLVFQIVLAVTGYLRQLSDLHVLPESPSRSREGGWMIAIGLAVSIGISMWSRHMLKKKLKGMNSDEQATVLTLRGSRCAHVCGIELLTPVCAFAGNRRSANEKARGKKGGLLGGGAKVKVYYEDGWHILSVGVGRRLISIKEGGLEIFTGPITPLSHPSGTTVDVGKHGQFKIYWGEELQPINTSLGSDTRVGINSAWPYFLYIEWIDKRLGEATTWPLLQYEFDIPPNQAACTAIGLTGDGYFPPTRTLSPGAPVDIFAVTNGAPGTARFTIIGANFDFIAGSNLRLEGNVLSDRTLAVSHNVIYEFEVSPGVFENRTDVYLTLTLSGADAAGTIRSLAALQAAKAEVDIFTVTNGAPGTAHFTVLGDHLPDFHAAELIRLKGNALSDRDLTVLVALAYQFELVAPRPPGTLSPEDPGAPGQYQTRTDVYVTTTLSGADANGTIQEYTSALDDGYNPVHILAHYLFAEAPLGLGRKVQFYDPASFVATAAIAQAENLRCSTKGEDGAPIEGIIQGLMQDCGFVLPIDTATGLIKLVAMRETADYGALPEITADMLITNSIQTTYRLAGWQMDQAVINFKNRQQNYRDDPLIYSNDSILSQGKLANVRTIEVSSTHHFGTAEKFAKRLALADLSPNAHFEIEAKNATRTLIPGQAVKVTGLDTIFRLITVAAQEKTDTTKLGGFADNYGARPSGAIVGDFGHGDPLQPARVDLIVKLLEVPEAALDATNTPTTLVIRVRAHEQIKGANILTSPDGVSYESEGNDPNQAAGGELLEALKDTDLYFIEEGPTFTTLGPDIGTVADLSGDEARWRRGDQLCLIDDELFFLRNVTAMGGNVWRLDGLIRARFDTRPATHPIGSDVVIFEQDEVFGFQETSQVPESTIYVKPVPFAQDSMTPDQIAATQIWYIGKGIRPVPPSEPRLTTIRKAYVTGESVTINWGYFAPRNKNAGAGNFPAGSVVTMVDPEGPFKLEILSNLDVIKRTEILTANTFAYSNANLNSDFGGEPATYKIRVSQIRGGYTSASSATTIITKI